MLNTNLFLDCAKLRGYIVSEVNAVSSNPFVSLSTKIKITFPLSSICTYEFILFPKTITFSPKLTSVNKSSERESSPTS